MNDDELAARLAPELSVYDRITLNEMARKGWFWDIDGWSDDLVQRRLIKRAEDVPGNAFRLTALGEACVRVLRAKAAEQENSAQTEVSLEDTGE